MYNPVNIEQLSKNQVSRLLNGHPVRVKYNPKGRHVVHMSREQTKKLGKASTKGGAINLMMDPYQIQHHQYLRNEASGGKLNLKSIGRTLKKAFTSDIGKQIQHGALTAAMDVAKSSGYVPPQYASQIEQLGHKAISAEGLKEMFQAAKTHGKSMAKRAAPHLSKYLKEEAQLLRQPAESFAHSMISPYVGDEQARNIVSFGANKAHEMVNKGITHVTGHGKGKAMLRLKLKKPSRKSKGGAVGSLFPPGGGALFPSGYYEK